MTKAHFPFDAGAGANVQEAQWTKMARFWLATGVLPGELNELEVYADSSGMQAKIKTGRAWIRGHYYENDAEETVAISAADPANPRIDQVILRVNWTANTVDTSVLEGTAAAAPAPPALTQSSSLWEISLAQVLVDAAAVTIAATKITDERAFAQNVNAAGAGALSNLLTNGGFEVWQRGAGAFTAANAYTADRWQIILAGTDTLQINREGTTKKTNSLYAAKGAFVLGSGAGASRFKQRLKISDGYHHLLGEVISFRLAVHANAARAIRAIVTTDGTGGTSTYSGYHAGDSAFTDLDVVRVAVPSDATYIDVGLALAASVTFYADNAMVVLGPGAMEYQALTPADEWKRCQRYYEIHGGASGGPVRVGRLYAGAASDYQVGVACALKAGTPTVTKNGTWAVSNCAQPTVSEPQTNGYLLSAIATGAGDMFTAPNGADDTVTIEVNP